MGTNMVWIDIIAVLILIFSFAGGLKEGAIRSFFSCISLIISIPVTSATYYLLSSVFGFIADDNWRNFLGFFGTFIIISIILGILLWLPRRFFEKFWNGGCIFSIVGGFFSLASAAISLALLAIIVHAFPIFDWLDYALTNSSVISWLVANLGFIKMMTPQISTNSQALTATFRVIPN
jgi:uncharacterized membrane protein required for colicin V production